MRWAPGQAVDVERSQVLGAIQQQAGVDILLVTTVVGERRLHRLAWQRVIPGQLVYIAVEGKQLADKRLDRNAVLPQASVGTSARITVGIEIDVALAQLLFTHSYTPALPPARPRLHPLGSSGTTS